MVASSAPRDRIAAVMPAKKGTSSASPTMRNMPAQVDAPRSAATAATTLAASAG